VEGPSGIGKSTAVAKALEDIGLDPDVTKLSARVPADVEYLDMLGELGDFGTIVIDDFHRLDAATKARIADLLKVTADTEDPLRKLVIIGINEAGSALIESAPDLANRIDVIRFETEPANKIDELVLAGEIAANLSIEARTLISEKASGSFFIAQLLCLDACIQAGILEVPSQPTVVVTSYSSVQRRVVERQRVRFGAAVRNFARGTKFRPGGRAPYLHILRWLAESDSWSISIPEAMRKHITEKASVGVVFDRGYLAALAQQPEIAKLMHFSDTGILSVGRPPRTARAHRGSRAERGRGARAQAVLGLQPHSPEAPARVPWTWSRYPACRSPGGCWSLPGSGPTRMGRLAPARSRRVTAHAAAPRGGAGGPGRRCRSRAARFRCS